MGTLGVVVGITEKYWVGWVLFGLMAVCAWHMARMLRSLRHTTDPEVALTPE